MLENVLSSPGPGIADEVGQPLLCSCCVGSETGVSTAACDRRGKERRRGRETHSMGDLVARATLWDFRPS